MYNDLMYPLCFYCGITESDGMDHVIPKSLGSHVDRPWNLVPACTFCNRKKSNTSLRDWLDDVAAMSASEFGHGPRHRGIMARQEIIVTTLQERPELKSYPKQVGYKRGGTGRSPVPSVGLP